MTDPLLQLNMLLGTKHAMNHKDSPREMVLDMVKTSKDKVKNLSRVHSHVLEVEQGLKKLVSGNEDMHPDLRAKITESVAKNMDDAIDELRKETGIGTNNFTKLNTSKEVTEAA